MLTSSNGKIELQAVNVSDTFDFYVGPEIGRRVVTTASVTARSYPDETSFIRVSHALWTWLFALAGGLAGRWLFTRRENPE